MSRPSFPRHSREGGNPEFFDSHEEWEIRDFVLALSSEKLPRRGKLQARNYQPVGKFPVVDQGQSEIAGWTNDEALVIDSGLPYVVFGDHTRSFKYADRLFALGADGTQLLKPSDEYYPRFFYYACLHLDLPSRGYNRHYSFLKEKTLPLPPKPEQEKIAAVLWKVQKAVEIQNKLIRTTRELKAAAMRRLFTHGLRNEPLKDTEIGPMPESWELVRLGDAYKTQLGKMLSQKARGGESPKPYLRNKNVQWGYLDLSDVLLMDFDEREATKFRLESGDLLVCEGGIIGRAAIWRGEMKECYYQKALHRIRPKNNLATNEFLCYWLSFSFEQQNLYNIGGASSTIAHIPQVLLEGLKIPLPDLDEQRDIATALATIDRKLAHHQKKHAALQDLFQTLLHKLMTAEIRVNHLDIDTSEVADHFADASKMIGKREKSASGDHFVDVNNMVVSGFKGAAS